MRLLLASITAILALVAFPAVSHSAGCDSGSREIPVLFERIAEDVAERYDLSSTEIDEAAPNAEAFGPLGRSKTSTFFEMKLSFAEEADCTRIESATLVYGLRNRSIFIATETQHNLCLAHEVLAHEYEHAAIDEAAVTRHGPDIEEAFRTAIYRHSAIAGEEREKVTAEFRERIAGEIRPLITELHQDQRVHHARLDHFTSRQRVMEKCESRN